MSCIEGEPEESRSLLWIKLFTYIDATSESTTKFPVIPQIGKWDCGSRRQEISPLHRARSMQAVSFGVGRRVK